MALEQGKPAPLFTLLDAIANAAPPRRNARRFSKPVRSVTSDARISSGRFMIMGLPLAGAARSSRYTLGKLSGCVFDQPACA